MELILEPWPWYITGPFIGLIVPLMAWLDSSFGVSSNLESICSIVGAHKVSDYFDNNLEKKKPGLLFVSGTIIGGFFVANFLTDQDYVVNISNSTVEAITDFGFTDFTGLQPTEIFNWQFLFSVKGGLLLCLGGFLIGFGTRYAGGCTSGHSISGLSNLQPKSLIATIGFFVGGLISTHFILPLILTP